MRNISIIASVTLLLGCGGGTPTLVVSETAGTPQAGEYVDPAGRFRFTVPASFGTTSPGTNDGFEDRAAAIRFSVFSSGGVGGEAVVTRGAPTLDVLAAGGLYDGIAREALNDALRSAVRAALPVLTPANICQQLAAEQHLDPAGPVFAPLSPAHRQALSGLDRAGNVAPVVRVCDVAGDIVVFEKEAAHDLGGPRRSIHGAVRFVSGMFSSFQIVRAGPRPEAQVLAEMRQTVASWRTP
ncbi:MAG: hypothetical protein ABIS06_08390 [Vicinamibacterales bacterium]